MLLLQELYLLWVKKMASSKIVKSFLNNLLAKSEGDTDSILRNYTEQQAIKEYGPMLENMVKADPRLLDLYTPEGLVRSIYNQVAGGDQREVLMAPKTFVDLAAPMPTDIEGFEYIRDVIEKKKKDIQQGIPRELYREPELGMRLDDDNSVFINMHDGRHFNTALKELGYPYSKVTVVPQYRTPPIDELPPSTPVYSETSTIDPEIAEQMGIKTDKYKETERQKVGVLGELVKFLGLGSVAAPGVLSQLPSGDGGGKVVE